LKNLDLRLAEDYRGPKASFSEIHVLKAILVIGDSGTIGRGRLGSKLGLGQGEVKTLIRRLRERKLIAVTTGGCALTEGGLKKFRAISRSLPWLERVNGSSLGLGRYTWAAILRGRASKVKKGIEQRDEAIKAGARSALTLLYSSDRFRVPADGTDCERANPKGPWDELRLAKPRERDVIIISGADTPTRAEEGVLSAALSLLR
jgi:DNA-binding MarR family transcriptional regulator